MSIQLPEKRQTRSTRIVFYYDTGVQPKDCDVKRILDILKRLQELEVNVKIWTRMGIARMGIAMRSAPVPTLTSRERM